MRCTWIHEGLPHMVFPAPAQLTCSSSVGRSLVYGVHQVLQILSQTQMIKQKSEIRGKKDVDEPLWCHQAFY
jgi:hypothetical protein